MKERKKDRNTEELMCDEKLGNFLCSDYLIFWVPFTPVLIKFLTFHLNLLFIIEKCYLNFDVCIYENFF